MILVALSPGRLFIGPDEIRHELGQVDTASPCESRSWHVDADGDGYGNPAVTVELCDQPSRHVSDSTGCDDGDAAVNPGATEVCDGADDDCDGPVDDDDPGVTGGSTWYAGADGDGYGDLPIGALRQESCGYGSGAACLFYGGPRALARPVPPAHHLGGIHGTWRCAPVAGRRASSSPRGSDLATRPGAGSGPRPAARSREFLRALRQPGRRHRLPAPRREPDPHSVPPGALAVPPRGRGAPPRQMPGIISGPRRPAPQLDTHPGPP